MIHIRNIENILSNINILNNIAYGISVHAHLELRKKDHTEGPPISELFLHFTGYG